LVLAGSG
jgi:hypothetical protein